MGHVATGEVVYTMCTCHLMCIHVYTVCVREVHCVYMYIVHVCIVCIHVHVHVHVHVCTCVCTQGFIQNRGEGPGVSLPLQAHFLP